MLVIPSRIKRAHDRTSCYIKMTPCPIENSVIDNGGGITIVCGFLRFEFIHKIFIIDVFLCHNYLYIKITAAKIAQWKRK